MSKTVILKKDDIPVFEQADGVVTTLMVNKDKCGAPFTSGTTSDPMYQQAMEVVYESGSASASMLQRRLRVGYNRAANLIEQMEKNGIVGPAQGSKPRKVLSRSE